jgi:hypothetical protein
MSDYNFRGVWLPSDHQTTSSRPIPAVEISVFRGLGDLTLAETDVLDEDPAALLALAVTSGAEGAGPLMIRWGGGRI